MGCRQTPKLRAHSAELRTMTLQERKGKADCREYRELTKKPRAPEGAASRTMKQRGRPAQTAKKSATVGKIKHLVSGFPPAQQAMLFRFCQRLGEIDLGTAIKTVVSTLPPAEQHAAFQMMRLVLDLVEADAPQEERDSILLDALTKQRRVRGRP